MFFGVLLISSAASQLPFVETFEAADGVAVGTINGQNDWALESGIAQNASVQSNVFQSGSQALELQNAVVSHALSNNNASVWLHFQARCTAAPAANPSVSGANTSLAFFVNTNLNLVVYSNTVPVELSVQMPTNIWTRFDIYCDYDDLYWDLSMNGINIASGLPLYSTNTQMESLLISNTSTSPVYVDQIDVVDTEQTAGGLPDSDGDGIPDWWEQKHFGGVTNVVAGNPSGNTGFSYLDTYIAGLSPFYFDPFSISAVPGGNGLSWTPVVSRLYSVYWSSNLLEGFTWQQDIPYPQSEFIDPVHTNEPAGFYRLEVRVE